MKRRVQSPLALLACVALGIGAAAAQATPGDHKVQICHGTASETNPYVLITVDEHALKGHFDDGVSAPGHGWKNNPDLLITDEVPECPGSGGEGEIAS